MTVGRKLGSVELQCVQGDITAQRGIDAIVNAANAQLLSGGGVAGAIHRAAGPRLAQEASALAPISPGQAVITSAFDLPNRYVIHCLGPVYGQDEPSAELLADCYRNALRLADEHDLESIAFPAISTGVFAYPLGEAARVSLTAVQQFAPNLEQVRLVRFVLFGQSDFEVFARALEALTPSSNTAPRPAGS